MDFREAMNYFYYRSSVSELRMMHRRDHTFGVSYHSLLFLNIIAHTEDCTVSKLADILNITKPAVTIKVNELTRRGFVQKKRSATDGRVFFLTLSPDMAATYDMFNRLSDDTEAMLRGEYTRDEVRLFSEMLGRIADYYE
ncbi:MAG: MarR family transcriptional regulator [Oscillospiraceae bacterium]|nr:MarR family transcriptional regulator [Oscillospiraceae bacterium]